MIYRSYQYLRPLVVFAGVLGIIQSLAWIAMAITGLVAYYCHMDLTTHGFTLGSVHALTFFHMYFNGSCQAIEFPNQQFLDTSLIDSLDLMSPQDLHAFMWVYLIISFFWLISSIVMIIYVIHEYLRFANIFLYVWISITVVIAIIDLGLGIVFGIDFGIFQTQLDAIQISQQLLTPNSYFLLLTGQTVSGIMMVVCYRGFILWIINICLAGYLFSETFKIYDYNKMKVGFSNPGFISDSHTMHTGATPIDAYGLKQSGYNQHQSSFGYQTHDRRDDRRDDRFNDRRHTVQQQRRHEDEDVQIRRDPSREVVRELNDRNSYNQGNPRSPRMESSMQMPAPDYSPPMPRTNPFESRPPLRSALRTSRY